MKALSILQALSLISVVLSGCIRLRRPEVHDGVERQQNKLPPRRKLHVSTGSLFGDAAYFTRSAWRAVISPFSFLGCGDDDDEDEEPGDDNATPRPTPSPTRPPGTPERAPTKNPTDAPNPYPTYPTKAPTEKPTNSPTRTPTQAPTISPTKMPTKSPTRAPTPVPTGTPTKYPTGPPNPDPTKKPTNSPTPNPTKPPTKPPTNAPTTLSPTKMPTKGPTKAPTPSPTNAPTVFNPSVEYLGCWVDASSPRAMEKSGGSDYSIVSCIEYCKGLNYPFAGLQFFSQCTCGNSYNRHGSAPESECNTNCRIGTGVCGGSWRISVYTTGIHVAPEPTPAPTPPPPAPSNFNIALGLLGVADDSDFTNAVTNWGQAILGDLPDFTGYLGVGSSCGSWPSSVDDVYICGRYTSIDGPGGVLGSAGPRHYRPSLGLPLTGEMKFDSADVTRPNINMLGIILHEMGHVLGIGPLWQINGLVDNFNVPCPYKTNSAASREYQSMSGCSGETIPVEMSFSNSGSNCGHWSEACFGTEIMTPAASGTLPISRVTLAGLEDLGYQVNYGASANFEGTNLAGSCRCNNRLRRRLNNGTLVDDERSLSTTPKQNRRQLSEEGYQRATDYGQLMLAENRQFMSLRPSDVPDIGGEIINVLYEENGVIHGVMVVREDIE